MMPAGHLLKASARILSERFAPKTENPFSILIIKCNDIIEKARRKV